MTGNEPTIQPAPPAEQRRGPVVPAILAVVAIAAVGAAGYLILRARTHLQAQTFVQLHGGTVKWSVDRATWLVGGETDVNLSDRRSSSFLHGDPLKPDDLGPLTDLHRVVRLDLSGVVHATPTALVVLRLSGVVHATPTPLAVLRKLPHLRELDLSRKGQRNGFTYGPTVDGGVLASLAGLPELTELRLAGQRVTDADLDRIANLTKLEVLDLRGTSITDAGLATLARLPKLTTLDLSDTDVTKEAVATFLEQRPGVFVLAPEVFPAPKAKSYR